MFWATSHHLAAPKKKLRFEEKSGFSLVEVVIALGIVSFAVIAIVGMLPVALKSSQVSMRETDATLIAQRVFCELATGSGVNRTITTNSSGGTRTIHVATHNNTNNFLCFKENGEVQSYTNTAAPSTAIDYYAQISVFTNTGISNLSQIQIDITYPPAAPPSARTTNTFVTLLGF